MTQPAMLLVPNRVRWVEPVGYRFNRNLRELRSQVSFRLFVLAPLLALGVTAILFAGLAWKAGVPLASVPFPWWGVIAAAAGLMPVLFGLAAVTGSLVMVDIRQRDIRWTEGKTNARVPARTLVSIRCRRSTSGRCVLSMRYRSPSGTRRKFFCIAKKIDQAELQRLIDAILADTQHHA